MHQVPASLYHYIWELGVSTINSATLTVPDYFTHDLCQAGGHFYNSCQNLISVQISSLLSLRSLICRWQLWSLYYCIRYTVSGKLKNQIKSKFLKNFNLMFNLTSDFPQLLNLMISKVGEMLVFCSDMIIFLWTQVVNVS